MTDAGMSIALREPSAQGCPVCHAAPGVPCRSGGKVRRAGMHHERMKAEHGAWTLTYDREHRELPFGKRFQTAPYRRS